MINIEIYQNEEVPLITMDFPAMIRVGETLSILNDDYFTYYNVKKIWYRIERDGQQCVPCAEVEIDD